MAVNSCSINLDPDASGNMYYRGMWEFCPEYKTGDVVIHNSIMYLCKKPHAGKEPSEKDNAEYWHKITPQAPKDDNKIIRRVLDGGFATTLSNDVYRETELIDEINGGSSSDRITVPLI